MFPLGDASRQMRHFPIVTLLIIGLDAYKDKFHPDWSLCYLVFRNPSSLPT